MPRPYLPHLIALPKVANSFHLDAAAEKQISKALGLKKLTKRTVVWIEQAVNCYCATSSGYKSATVASTLLALRQLEKPGRNRDDALELFANDRAAVDYTTLNLIQPLAKAVLDGRPNANNALKQAAGNRAVELTVHPRISTSNEPMRQFSGILRLIFNASSRHLQRTITQEELWHRCRRFALEIFAAARIDHAEFDCHPDRLTKYLGTEIE